jgi:NADPH:quinone reductase-like Zn-dependent oxidoreductase
MRQDGGERTMRAIVQDRYGAPGDVLDARDIDTPALHPDAVLVRVHATSVNPADWHMMRGDPYIARLQMGLRKPKRVVLGWDVAGTVEAVGANVTTLRVGDEVYGSPFDGGTGAFAELSRVPQDGVARKPAGLSFEQAAAVPLAGLTALQGLRDHGRIAAGMKVLVIGASGGVGTFAVQIGKAYDTEVTGVCSTGNVALVRSLGADHVIDYTREDFAEGGLRYDLILQVGGTASPSHCRRALTPDGTLVLSSGEPRRRVFGPVGRMVKAMALSRLVSQRMVAFVMKATRDDLEAMSALIESGKVTPVIDTSFPLSQVAEAIRYLEEGRARGKVVVTV